MNHKESKHPHFFRDAVIGFGDGMIIPFALAAALTYINLSPEQVLRICIVVIVAGGILMAMAAFYSGKDLQPSNHHHDHQFADLGLPEEIQQDAAKVTKEEEELFFKQLNDDSSATSSSAITIGIFHIIGGIIALLPYLFIKGSGALSLSFSIIPLFLFATGYLRNSQPGSKPLNGGFRTMLYGLLTAAAACSVAFLFRT